MKVVYYVSGHGFGHSVRASNVIRELYKRGATIDIVSDAPKYIFDCNLDGIPYGFHPATVDVGVVQEDSFSNDLPETARRWQSFLDNEPRWMERHSRLWDELSPDVVVSDISCLPLKLARKRGVPSVLVTTFTWDWILDFYRDDDPVFGILAETIRPFFHEAGLVITTPFGYGLPKFDNLKVVPLIGRHVSASKEELRKKSGLDERPAALLSFGGFGIKHTELIGYDRIPGWQFITLGRKADSQNNLRTITNEEANSAELVKACDVVISKPGYGIAVEATLGRTSIIYTERGKFAEYEPLAKELGRYLPALYIPKVELFSGRLGEYLDRIPPFTKEHQTDPGDGAQQAAELIVS